MTLFLLLLLLAVVGLVGAVAAGRVTGGLAPPAPSLPARGLEAVAGPGLTPDEVDGLRFSPALRGYRMDQVDAVLDLLADELRRRDDEIADLRARHAPAEPEL